MSVYIKESVVTGTHKCVCAQSVVFHAIANSFLCTGLCIACGRFANQQRKSLGQRNAFEIADVLLQLFHGEALMMVLPTY